MSNNAKATVKAGNNTIVFEGSEEFVERQVEKYNAQTSKSQDLIDITREYSQAGPGKLIEEKRPRGHHEVVTVLAFYLQEAGVQEFSEADVKRMYLQAKIRPPKVIAQALRDAKNNHDYIDSGAKRGTYRLSPHGDRTVRFDLPRGNS